MNPATLWRHPALRRLRWLGLALALVAGVYLAWSPGKTIRDGRHDRRMNGIWLQHGWLGDDGWFERHGRDRTKFRRVEPVRALAAQLRDRGIKWVFPHLCPCDPDGTVPPVDATQTARFLDEFGGINVVPWIGGVYADQCSPESPRWRAQFVASARALLEAHPRLAGVQVNIEPLPDGDPGFLVLLDELRGALPAGRILSVAAYPPPTRWHDVPEVHWSEPYFREVARRVDLMLPMMYDTAIQLQKPYRRLMADWTVEVLEWSGRTPVLLGVPAYDDAGTGYHHPRVENLGNALVGIHAGLIRLGRLPANYLGVAIYSEWELDAREWELWRREFERPPGTAP